MLLYEDLFLGRTTGVSEKSDLKNFSFEKKKIKQESLVLTIGHF